MIVRNFKQEIKRKFIEWCASSTSHGIPNIVKTENWIIKFMWLGFVIVSSALCGLLISRSIGDFLSFDVVTKIRVYRQLPVEYPTITICNINPLTTEFASQMLNESYQQWYLSISQNVDNSLLEGYSNVFQYETTHPSFTDDQRRQLGPDISEMLINCAFASQSCIYLNLDGEKFWIDFAWVYTINYGNCYRFNSGLDTFGNEMPIKNVSKEGKYSELDLDLFIVENQQIPNLNPNKGFRIFIENRSDVLSTFDGGIDVKPGTLTELTLKKVVTERMQPPFSECQKEYPQDIIYNTYRAKRITYKQRDCFNLCIQKKIIEKCACYNLIYEPIAEYSNVEPCDFRSNCLSDYCTPFSIYSLPNTLARSCSNDEANTFCSTLCKKECTTIEFEVNSAFSDFPTQRNLELSYKNSFYVKKNFLKEGIQPDDITNEMLKSKIAKVRILFEDLSYTTMTESEKFNFVDLASSIGGTLGLFLGISILSFIEVFELFLNIIILKLSWRNFTNKNSDMVSDSIESNIEIGTFDSESDAKSIKPIEDFEKPKEI